MPPDQDDLDTPISLHPLTGEEALRRLLGADNDDLDPDDSEDEES